MAKILFFNTHDYDDIYASLSLVKELQKSGQEIIYYTSAHHKDEIKNAGVVFRDYTHFTAPPSGPTLIERESFIDVLYPTVFFNMKVRNKIIDLIYQDVEQLKPDFIIYGHQSFWGKEIARRLNIPAVCIYSTMVITRELVYNEPQEFIRICLGNLFAPSLKEIKHIYGTLNKVFKNMHGIGDFYEGLVADGGLNIVMTSKFIQPFAASLDDKYQFAGYCPYPDKLKTPPPGEDLSNEDPLIYVAATPADKYHKNWNTKYYPILFNGLKDTPNKVVVNYQCADQNFYDLPATPRNFTVGAYRHHDQIIPGADLVITNGTYTVVHEALLSGIPLIVIPVGGDQFMFAERVENLKLGICIRHDQFSETSLQEAIAKIRSDENYRANCKHYGQTIRESNESGRAAKLILDYMKSRV